MKLIPSVRLLLLAFAAALAVAPAALASSIITYSYTGTLQYNSLDSDGAPDAAGLNGAHFSIQATANANATRTYTNGVNTDGFAAFTMSVTLTNTVGGTYNGVYTPPTPYLNQQIFEVYTSSFGDVYFYGPISFGTQPFDLDVGDITLKQGVITNESSSSFLTPFTSSQIQSGGYQQFMVNNEATEQTAEYDVIGGSASAIVTPEPSTAPLMLGSGAMLLLRRRRRTAV